MIGANPPGHFLWDAKTTDEQIDRYAALCAEDASLPRAHRRPRRLAPLGLRRHSGPLVVPADQDGQRQDRRVLRADGSTTDGAGPLSAPWTIDTLLAADEGRRERGVAPVADGPGRLPERAGLGRRRRRRPDRRRARPALLRRPRRRADRSSAAPAPTSSGAAAGCTTLAGEPGRERVHPRADSNVETLLIGGKLDFATPPQSATTRAAPAPAERPPGRAAGLRPHGRLLDVPAGGRQAG